MPKLTKQLKKGVTVQVTTGKDKGKSGKVINILWDRERVLVEKLNLQKRHTKPSGANKTGGIIEKEGSIHFSNVIILDTASAAAKPAKTAKTAAAKKPASSAAKETKSAAKTTKKVAKKG